MRLRPSGKGGLALTQIGAFEDYQRREAWTWEHQALLHSRWVAGDAGARRAFARVRRAVLREAVKRETLREDILAMRERMRARAVAHARGTVRPQAGPRRHRRHRVPGAVLGAPLGARVPAARRVRGHDPPPRVGGFGGAGRRGSSTGWSTPTGATAAAPPPVAGSQPADRRGRHICRPARGGDAHLERVMSRAPAPYNRAA